MMHIQSLAIYGKNGLKRVLPFDQGAVSVITGKSKTGKSAICQIIDYCFGSKSCDIPAGIIKNSSDWFCLLLTCDQEDVFIARKNPQEGNVSSEEIYFEISNNFILPDFVSWKPNTNRNGLVSFLSQKLGIEENVHLTPDGQTRDDLTATIRHCLYYCIQRQYVIANPEVLFHKQEDSFVRMAIKDSFPYFAGAVEKNYVELKTKLKDLRRQLKILERKQNDSLSIQGGKNKALLLLDECALFGILEDSYSEKSTKEELVDLLRRVSQQNPQKQCFVNRPGMDDFTVKQIALSQKQKECEQINIDIQDVRMLIGNSESYNDELQEQKKRLESIGLYDGIAFDNRKCPFCSCYMENEIPSIEDMKKEVIRVHDVLSGSLSNISSLRGYLEELQNKKIEIEQEIELLKQSLLNIQQNAEELKKIDDVNFRHGKILGKIDLWLDSCKETPVNDSEINLIKDEIERIENELSEESLKERLDSIISIISSDMSKWVKELDLEYSDSPYRFSLNNLTVVADTENDGPVALKNMGSGSNWVGMHLLTFFAIQKHFCQKNRPVPSFLILDQPSQIYFPNDRDKTDEQKVKQIYEFIFKRAEELNGKLQVIVLDHADFMDDEKFNNAVVERWDDNNALIPYEWVTAT